MQVELSPVSIQVCRLQIFIQLFMETHWVINEYWIEYCLVHRISARIIFENSFSINLFSCSDRDFISVLLRFERNITLEISSIITNFIEKYQCTGSTTECCFSNPGSSPISKCWEVTLVRLLDDGPFWKYGYRLFIGQPSHKTNLPSSSSTVNSFFIIQYFQYIILDLQFSAFLQFPQNDP